jgi:hypothetical protein
MQYVKDIFGEVRLEKSGTPIKCGEEIIFETGIEYEKGAKDRFEEDLRESKRTPGSHGIGEKDLEEKLVKDAGKLNYKLRHYHDYEKCQFCGRDLNEALGVNRRKDSKYCSTACKNRERYSKRREIDKRKGEYKPRYGGKRK